MNRSLGTGALLVFLCLSASGAPLEESSDQTFPMSANGSLKVQDTDGTVYIYAWLDRGVRIMSRKRAYTSDRLKQISVNIASNADVTTVETIFPPKPDGLSLADRSGTVDYLICVPQKASVAVELSAGEIIVEGMYGSSVNARLTNGRVTMRNCFSDAQATVMDGALDLIYDWSEAMRFPFIGDVARGHVRLFLPTNAAAQIEAESGDGKIQFALNGERIERMGRLRTSIGGGNGPEFKLHAAHGNIGISKNE